MPTELIVLQGEPQWAPWVGWTFGFAVGWAMADDWYWWCYCPPAPYWGPYYHPGYGAYHNAYGGITAWGRYGWAGTSGHIYHQHGPWTGVSRAAAGYNAWTGNQWATQYGRAYNSTTGTRVVGQPRHGRSRDDTMLRVGERRRQTSTAAACQPRRRSPA